MANANLLRMLEDMTISVAWRRGDLWGPSHLNLEQEVNSRSSSMTVTRIHVKCLICDFKLREERSPPL